jgi:hypothetical protein
MLSSLSEKPINSRRGLASMHLATDVAVSIMHSDRFQLKGLLCLCNLYAGVASARVTHWTRVLHARFLLPNQAPEIQVLLFTNVVWLHYRAALMHKIFGVSVNILDNVMHIHSLLMIGSVFGNDFPLILIIIGNVLRLRGLNWLDRRGDGIRTLTGLTSERMSKSWTMEDQRYMGRALSTNWTKKVQEITTLFKRLRLGIKTYQLSEFLGAMRIYSGPRRI